MSWSKKDFFKFSVLSLLLVALALAWLGFGEHGSVHLYRMERERQTYLEKIHHLEQENRELMDEIHRLRTDREYVESMGRRELGLIKNDELIYRFDRQKERGSPPDTVKEDAPQQ